MSKPKVRCDHATDPKCPWKRCPHHGWHEEIRPSDLDCGPNSCETRGAIVFQSVRCIKKEATT